MSVGSPWPWPAPGSADDLALRADECVREDYDVAQRLARERARFRGVKQRVAKRWKQRRVPVGAAGRWYWSVMDVGGPNEYLGPGELPPRGIVAAVAAVPALPSGPLTAELLIAARDSLPPGFRSYR